METYVQPNITSHFSATPRMDNELSGEWVGSIEETDERALQWFAINLMTHNLHNKGLVSGTAVIVSIYEEQTTCLVTLAPFYDQNPFLLYFMFLQTR